MPAKRKAETDLPKKMQELKEYLEANNNGRPLCREQIKAADPKLRNQACNSMVRTLEGAQQLAYKRCQTDVERHQWIMDYILDPQKVKHEGSTTIRRESLTESKDTFVWVTEEELASSRYMNSQEHAKLAVKCLPSRPHDLDYLAKAGVLQYYYNTKEESNKKLISEAAELTQHSELTAKEAEETREHMSNSRNPGEEQPKSKKTKKMLQISDKDTEDKQEPSETPEKKAHKAGLSLFNPFFPRLPFQCVSHPFGLEIP